MASDNQEPREPQDTTPAGPSRRGRLPSGSVVPRRQIGLEDEFFNEELHGQIRDMLDIMEHNQDLLQSEENQHYKEAARVLKNIKADIREAVPRDGKHHQYRVDGYLIELGVLSEDKDYTRRGRQVIRIKRSPVAVSSD